LIVVVRVTDIGDKNSKQKIAHRIKKNLHSLIYNRQGNRLVKFIKDLKEVSCGSIRDRFFPLNYQFGFPLWISRLKEISVMRGVSTMRKKIHFIHLFILY